MRVMPAAAPDAGALRSSALASILPAVTLGGLAAVAFGEIAALSPAYPLRALLLLGAGAVLLIVGLPAHPHARFGIANQLTLARAVGVVLLAASIGEGREPALDSLALGVAAAVLDAVDGRVARGRGLASRYGARFDMETDALLIAVLAVLLWTGGRLGAWVLIAGALRYVFIGVQQVVPRLRVELAPSWRRQACAVLQVVTLLIAFAPFVPRRLAVAAAALGVAALCGSFATDLVAMWRQGVRA